MDILEWTRSELRACAEDQYKNFHQSLVPGLTSILGVRVPKCREIARKIAKDDWKAFLAGADDGCYEELMLRGLVTGYAKMDLEMRAKYMADFVPRIDNWAICDCCCSTFKFMRRDPKYWLSFILPYLDSGREFEVRFAVVSMMDHFLEEPYRELQFEAYERIFKPDYLWKKIGGTDGPKTDGDSRMSSGLKNSGSADSVSDAAQKNEAPFYVRMAAAWALSSWYVRFPQETEAFLERGTLDVFTHNKTIQKIRESYRVPAIDKERLKQLKR